MKKQYFFSASTKGFYDSTLHTGNQIPKDAREITEQQFNACLLSNAQGNEVAADARGLPVTIFKKSEDRMDPRGRRNAALKSTDNVMLLHWTGEKVLSAEDHASLASYRKALRDWPESEQFPGALPQRPAFLK